MHIPKSALFALALIGAAFVGWMLHTSGGAAAAAPQLATETAYGGGASAQRPVQVTVVLPDAGSNLGTSGATALPSRGWTPGYADSQASASLGGRRMYVPEATASTAPARDSWWTSPAPQAPAWTAPARDPWWTSPAPRDPAWTSTDIQGPRQVQGLSVIANGDHIVIANQGSIVSVGDNTLVKGNTGDAAASGSIAVDVADSSLTSGDSGLSAAPGSAVPQWAGWAPSPAGWATSPLHAMDGGGYPPPDALLPVASAKTALDNARANGLGALPMAGSLTGGSAGGPASRAIGIAGYEDHSVDIGGSDNLVTYDDSDLFFHRSGTLNGNTGDTDTSGLNVVDSAGSRVRSGDSGNSDETPDPPPFDPASLGSPSLSGVLTNNPTAPGASVSIADINGISTATGQDSLVVGGDGMDDNGVRVRGDRNVATYDDGNVAIGGAGNVNAQVGDSDTSGAVVMGVRNSDVASGNSFLPASQQAGAQVGDPFDGNDPDLGAPDAPTPRLTGPPVHPNTTPTTTS